MGRTLSVGDKLLLTLAALLALEAGVRACVDWVRESEAFHKEFVRDGKDHVRNLALTSRDALMVGDRRKLEHCAELLRTPEDDDLVYAAFYAPDGNLIACRSWAKSSIQIPQRIEPSGEPTVRERGGPGVAADAYTFIFPVAWAPTDAAEGHAVGHALTPLARSGTVVTVRSPHAVEQKIATSLSTTLLVTAAMLALCLNVLLVFARRLVAPLRDFVRGTERIAAGNFTTPIDVGPRRDELHTLAEGFNRMAGQLKSQREQILEHSRQLERKVTERTAELVEANRQIRQAQGELVQAEKMRMLGQLAAGIAHEINTPTGAILNVAVDSRADLQAIVDAAARIPELPPDTRRWLADVVPEILARGLRPSDAVTRIRRRALERDLRAQGLAEWRRIALLAVNAGLDEPAWDDRLLAHLLRAPVLDLLERLESLASAAGITHSSAEKIARIVRALRLYTRAEQATLIDADVNETIDNTLAILQNRIKHVAEMRTAYGSDLPAARCGPAISQVWTNLLNNACDAIEEAGPQGPARIEIATALADGRLRVTIFNSGRPIPEGIRERIFDPFFTTKPAGKGTGLGLSLCAGILRDCGGTIRTWNEAGGVVFEVTLLPAEAAPPAEPGATAGAAGDADGQPLITRE